MRVLIVTSHDEYFTWLSTQVGNKAKITTINPNWLDVDEYDIGISFMYLHKIPKEHLVHPWFNFHPGPLPEYKGRNLCYHAIMNGEKEFGATFHYMDENFDMGDIIDVEKFGISDWWTAGELHNVVIGTAMGMFEEYFPRIIAGENFPRIKNKGGHYYKKEPIVDVLEADPYLEKWIRAVTYKDFYPKINIHGVTYKVVRE